VPGWLIAPITEAIYGRRADHELKRERGIMRHVRRYECVRDLRRGATKDRALDQAVELLAGTPDEAMRETIEKSYDLVRRDLDRAGHKSPFFFLTD
jgi:hypothetical protein